MKQEINAAEKSISLELSAPSEKTKSKLIILSPLVHSMLLSVSNVTATL